MATFDPFEAEIGLREKFPVELLAPNKREALAVYFRGKIMEWKETYPRRTTRDFFIRVVVTESTPAPVPVEKPIMGRDGKPVLGKDGQPKFPPAVKRPKAPPIPKAAFLEMHLRESYT